MLETFISLYKKVRNISIKYVKAARLSHQGVSVEEIAATVDLSRGEIEFIAKVNKDQLQFSLEDLPAWAKEEAHKPESFPSQDRVEPLLQKKSPGQPANHAQETLSQLGSQFRQALSPEPQANPVAPVRSSSREVPGVVLGPKVPQSFSPGPVAPGTIKKVIFPKIADGN